MHGPGTDFHLPPELWIHIFHLATSSPALHASQYEPFHPSFLSQDAASTLKVKSAIALVCRHWRAMSLEMLYEDVRIRHGDVALGRALVGHGRWVRRAILPYHHSETPTPHPIPALDILRQCPRLEVLVRPPLGWPPDRLRFEFPAEAISLPLLKRLDWWHHNPADRSGGINSLNEVLRSAPNLEYLSYGGEMWQVSLSRRSLELPALKVLRLRHIDAIFVRQICTWRLPSLTHLVMEWPTHPQVVEVLWETLGPGLETVELGIHLGFALRDYLSTVLTGCSNLREINYYIFFTMRLRDSVVHEHLKRVGLHAHANLTIDSNDDVVWAHVEDHLKAYHTETFPSLTEFVLYGPEWEPLIQHGRFSELEAMVAADGRSLVPTKT
ncbi:hypothetical protein BV25DRAFT_1377407 [Artomyces pyxidatus]|uniref:Uncharacterized protein n=1 Tax=Artomyces pyxidatus TaxID=48021 RepID=A0ACB8TDA1_9AGAM|nr:hypothetical protein BV25DRAFT_1377407 [Artomyces pyxidatus]